MKLLIATLAFGALAIGAQADNTMTLRQCIDYAIAHNITLKKSANTVEQQKLSVSTARNSRLPDLTAGADQSFNFGRGLNSENNYVNRNTNSTGFNLNTNVPLFTGFRIPNEIAMSRLNLQASLADLDKARQDIALQVTSAYLQAVYTHEMLSVTARQVELSKVQADRLQKMLDAGKVPQTDVAEALSQVAQDQLSQTQAINDYRLALLDLSQLLELSTPDSLGVIAPADDVPAMLPPTPNEIYAVALALKPQIQAEQIRLQASEKNIKVARAAYYPTLSLGGSLSSSYYKTSGSSAPSFSKQLNDNFNKAIGISLSIPIFNRLATRNAVRQAALQRDAQALQLDDTKKSLYKEIQQAYYNTLNADAKYRSSITAEKAADDNFVLVTRKYENGKANATEYAEAKTKQERAISERLQSKYEYIFRMKIINFYQGKEIN